MGERIAICPSHPCGLCKYCQLGLQNHCLDMRYFGSAMRMPHVQGAFRREIVVGVRQAYRLADGVSDAEGAMAEPLAVALHAVNRAGPLLGKSVLVTGCGPIGALVVVAARRAGAAFIAVTDVVAQPLRSARKVGADQTLNVAEQPDALQPFSADKGRFDALFEASGNERALRAGLDVLRPRGVIVQVGLSGGEMSLPINTIVAKEFDLRGTFRFHEEFARRGRVDQSRPGRSEAAGLRDLAVPRRGPRLCAGRRPFAVDEGAARLRLNVAALGACCRPGDPGRSRGVRISLLVGPLRRAAAWRGETGYNAAFLSRLAH